MSGEEIDDRKPPSTQGTTSDVQQVMVLPHTQTSEEIELRLRHEVVVFRHAHVGAVVGGSDRKALAQIPCIVGLRHEYSRSGYLVDSSRLALVYTGFSLPPFRLPVGCPNQPEQNRRRGHSPKNATTLRDRPTKVASLIE